jgi:DNA repair protein RecN (Recombination protein N)
VTAQVWGEIRLRRLGVIEEATLALDGGLTVVTGETGAGKTMVVTALGLLQGGRADPALVRHGADQARVEGRVALARLPEPLSTEVSELVSEVGGEPDDGDVIVARTIGATGRSRAHLGGASVPAAVLARLGDRLVAVHGQSDQLRLRQAAAQREALDRFGGAPVQTLLGRYRPAYRRLGQLRDDLSALQQADADRAREIDLLRLGLDEVAAVAPQDGEDEAVRREESRLAHAESLLTAAAEARACLVGGADVSDNGGSTDVDTLLGRARHSLDGAAAHDPAVAALAQRAADLSYSASDLASDLTDYVEQLDVDPRRLAAVQQRRSELATLARRYGPSIADVLAWADKSAQRLAELEMADDTISGLAAEADAVAAELAELASALTAARQQAATALQAEVSAELVELAMPHAVVTVRVSSGGGLGPDGADEVEFLLAANAGSPARPLGRGASGGELSRVMLALEVVLAATAPVPTFVFDEVDAGIGGRAAVEVGRRLARLSQHCQVLVVTHLPQVAAFADRHYVVDKSEDGTITTSGVHALDHDGQVRELSRMLAGLEGSTAAAAHAVELLELAAAERTRVKG